MLMKYRKEMGLEPEQAMGIGALIGGGMGHNGTCGALIAALMIAGFSEKPCSREQMSQSFAHDVGYLTCVDIKAHNVSCSLCIQAGCALADEALEATR